MRFPSILSVLVILCSILGADAFNYLWMFYTFVDYYNQPAIEPLPEEMQFSELDQFSGISCSPDNVIGSTYNPTAENACVDLDDDTDSFVLAYRLPLDRPAYAYYKSDCRGRGTKMDPKLGQRMHQYFSVTCYQVGVGDASKKWKGWPKNETRVRSIAFN